MVVPHIGAILPSRAGASDHTFRTQIFRRKSVPCEPRQRFNSLTNFPSREMTLETYVPVVIFALIALLFPLGTFFATRLFRPDHPTPLKDLTYECGEEPEGEAQIQFHFQYYMFGLIFVVFDVAAGFLLLCAFAWGGGLHFA